MEEYVKEALEIVKAQASVRSMTEEEISSMVMRVADSIKKITFGEAVPVAIEPGAEVKLDAKAAIKEKSVTCLECGKSFKVLTKRHLAQHGLNPAEYREKYGYKKGTSLIAKGLARDRRNKMKDMKLWEKRVKKSA